MTEAARRSGNSRQWWLEAEKGVRPPRPDKLARAVLAVGGDLAELFALAGYDPAPYAGEAAAAIDEEADIRAALAEQAAEIRRLGDLLERLIELLPPFQDSKLGV